jgi:hypothetical protein
MTYAPPPPPPAGFPAPPPGYPAPPPGYPGQPYAAASPANPVHLTIDIQDRYSRGLGCLGAIFFLGRAILAIPAAIVLVILMFVAEILAWLGEIAVVFSGHYPKGIHSFVTGTLRLTVRVYAYILGLTDKYPGFSISE